MPLTITYRELDLVSGQITHISEEEFKTRLAWLFAEGYELSTLAELKKMLNESRVQPYTSLIIIQDTTRIFPAFLTNIKLGEYGIRAILFSPVAPGNIP